MTLELAVMNTRHVARLGVDLVHGFVLGAAKHLANVVEDFVYIGCIVWQYSKIVVGQICDGGAHHSSRVRVPLVKMTACCFRLLSNLIWI